MDGGISFLLFVDASYGRICGDGTGCVFATGAGLRIFTTEGAEADRVLSRKPHKYAGRMPALPFCDCFGESGRKGKKKQASVKLDARASWGAAVLRPYTDLRRIAGAPRIGETMECSL